MLSSIASFTCLSVLHNIEQSPLTGIDLPRNCSSSSDNACGSSPSCLPEVGWV